MHVKGQEGSDASLYFDDDATDFLITPDTRWRVAERINPTLTRKPVIRERDWAEGSRLKSAYGTASNAVLSSLAPQIKQYEHDWDGFTVMLHVVNDEGTLGLARAVYFHYLNSQPAGHAILDNDPQLGADACTFTRLVCDGPPPGVTTIVLSYHRAKEALRS